MASTNRSLWHYEDTTPEEVREWFLSNYNVPLYAMGGYLLMISAGKHIMKDRPRFDLKGALIAWNIMLGLYSVISVIKVLPFLASIIYNHGFHASVCYPQYAEQIRGYPFWAWLFITSKVFELGDTVFVILRKQPLIFLHWYHHISVMLYCWFTIFEENGPGMWFLVMNASVHSFMYLYYALKALKLPVPRPVSMALTSLQLSQMFMAVYLSVYCYRVKSRGEYCGVPEETLRLSFLMYFSYALLFSHFFYKAYFGKRHSSTKKVE